jgi:hypothetical protein
VVFYGKYTSERDNTQSNVTKAVEEQSVEIESQLRVEYEEKSQSPYEIYQAPSAYSSIRVTYPRTYSAYVIEKTSGTLPINGYFHPKTVPDVASKTNFALRMKLETKSYSSVINSYQRSVDNGDLKATAVLINGVRGVRFDGAITRDKSGALVVLPLRDKTLSLWMESNVYLKDFEDVIIKNLTFQP